MENDFSSTNSTTGQSNAAPSSSDAANQNTTNTNTNTTSSQNTEHHFTDRARDLAGTAQGKLADMGSTVRDRAGHVKDSLADALENGADKLRNRTHSSSDQNGNLAGATTTGSVAMGDGRVGQVTDRVAAGMDKTAGWLRDADLEGVRTTIETQVKEHPGRTLLVAAGLGYLLGKALRK